MAQTLRTKLRIAGSVLLATGFWDAVAGRFLFEPRCQPPAPDAPPSPGAWDDWRGAVHIHSTYSDGASDVPTVMEAARKAGVDWLLLTDHNTQQPLRDGWEEKYPDKPLLLVGTEITVEHGAFLLALDMPPDYEPQKGKKPQHSIDAVQAQGGIPLVSLPFDVKHPWRDWNAATGCLGLEVVNLSTVARRHINLLSLVWLAALRKMGGDRAALRALLTRPDQALARWDLLTRGGTPSVGIGALDAHALMKIGKKKYPIPSYEDSFQAVSTHVLLPPDAPHAPDKRKALYDALRAGRCYIAYDLLGDPRPVRFFATNPHGETIPMGGKAARGTTLTAQAGAGVLLRLYHQGRVVAASVDGHLRHPADAPGAYRLEVCRYSARIGPFFFNARPWVFTNPVYIQ